MPPTFSIPKLRINITSDKNTGPPSINLFVFISALFITLLLSSNLIAIKLVDLFGQTLPAAILVFPIIYILGDVLTEVYGFKRARQTIFIGFGCNLIFVAIVWTSIQLSPSAAFENQSSYETILGTTPRILLASFCGYLVGELSNSYLLIKIKTATQGKWLWMRTIGSTIVGEGLDSVLFITIAFLPILPLSVVVEMILVQWIIKVTYEIIATPLTYAAVIAAKKSEYSLSG